jgi:hypothetical protein
MWVRDPQDGKEVAVPLQVPAFLTHPGGCAVSPNAPCAELYRCRMFRTTDERDRTVTHWFLAKGHFTAHDMIRTLREGYKP